MVVSWKRAQNISRPNPQKMPTKSTKYKKTINRNANGQKQPLTSGGLGHSSKIKNLLKRRTNYTKK
tara:strand:+ start:823 stop:1020 length:198 start_codon:yes stop_codon:yes gene_type:complete